MTHLVKQSAVQQALKKASPEAKPALCPNVTSIITSEADKMKPYQNPRPTPCATPSTAGGRNLSLVPGKPSGLLGLGEVTLTAHNGMNMPTGSGLTCTSIKSDNSGYASLQTTDLGMLPQRNMQVKG